MSRQPALALSCIHATTRAVKTQDLEFDGESVVLHADRAMIWPRRRTVFVADLHWGKRETFVVAGIPLPDGLLDHELARIDMLVREFRAERIVVLGDLVHSRAGITEPVIDRIGRWRQGGPQMVLVRGNHDRHVPELPAGWNIVDTMDTIEPPFFFTHVPRVEAGYHVLCGHLHPVVRLRSAGDGVRVPCFHLRPGCVVLPAFSEFTGGAVIRRMPQDRVYALAEGHVIDV